MSVSAIKRDGRKVGVLSRESIEQSLRDYAQLFGSDFTSAAFNPATAKWQDREYLIDRYYEGNPLRNGEAWPSLNSIRHAFGTFNAAREAIGLPVNKPGPSHKRPAHTHRPIRDVRERRLDAPRAAAQHAASAERRAMEAEERVARLKDQIADLRIVNQELRARKARVETRTKTKTKTKTVVKTDTRQVAKLQRALDRSAVELERSQATVDAAQAQIDQLERRVRAVLSERDQVHADGEARQRELTDRIDELEHALEMADEAKLAAARDEVMQARGRVSAALDAQHEAEAQAARERRSRQMAERDVQIANRETQNAVRERNELRQALTGQVRRLTTAELTKLRKEGPQGPAVFMAAVKQVVTAQTKGERQRLKAALMSVAEAAIGWRDRL